MTQWLKRLFREPDRFTLPPAKRPVPQCRIRPFDDADSEVCAEIYRLNEPGRFPPGYLEIFAESVRSRGALFLVCEVAGEIRGFGGLNMHRNSQAEVAYLSFLMVHPDHHRRGFGTAIMMAAFATLPPPDFQWAIFLSPISRSEMFYQRFGFRPAGRFTDERGTVHNQFLARLYKQDWQDCRDALASVPVALETAGVIVPPFRNRHISDASESGGNG